MSRKFRVFQGKDTKQVTFLGKSADAESWYFEPTDYEGDVLWSASYPSRRAAVAMIPETVGSDHVED